jgi:hypothetical protein
MSDPRTAHTRPSGDGGWALRLLGLAAVAVGVLLLAAVAFVLSYAGIHAVALSAGVSPRLARLYPVIFDAMLVVACAAILSLRGAGLPSRCYAWLTMLVLLVAAAGADTAHATGASLPHKPAAAAAAIIPWALVLIGFGLLLSMLRQARLRLAAGLDEEGLLDPSAPAEVTGGIDVLFGPRPSSSPDLLPVRNGFPAPNGSLASAQPAAPAEPPAPTLAPSDAGTGEHETEPEPEAAIEPEAKDQPEPETKDGPEPVAKTEPEPKDEPEPVARTEPEAKDEPEPGAEVGDRLEINGGAGPEAEAIAGPGPEPSGTAPVPARPEPAAADQPEASPVPALAATAQFDRLQSSPVQPEA